MKLVGAGQLGFTRMLWPEGSTAVIANLGSYLDPQLENEPVRSFVVSKAGAFMAVASKSILALFRLKPLSPLMIHPTMFAGTEILEVRASAKGDHLAVLTLDNRVSLFSVQPREDIEEVLKTACLTTPGMGESIGAREIWLEPLHSLRPEYEITTMGSWAGHLLLYSKDELHVVDWAAFDSEDKLNPPQLVPFPLKFPGLVLKSTAGGLGCRGQSQWINAVINEHGEVILGMWKGSSTSDLELISELKLELSEKAACLDYNVRLNKLAVATENNRIYVYPNLQDTSSFIELPVKSSRKPLTLQWNPAGTVLLVGYAEGWQLLSLLGLNVFSMRTMAKDNEEPVGTVKAEWMISAEALVLQGSDGKLRIQNMLRWNGTSGSDIGRPVLHGNGRLLLYHDANYRGIASGDNGASHQSWITVPLPTWYMAQNWPIGYLSSSSDGRYIAIAGKVGIMLFSAVTKQWKEIGDRESMIRGGLCWHGKMLVAACLNPDNDTTTLKMFSPVGSQNKRNSFSTPQSMLGSQFLWNASQPNNSPPSQSAMVRNPSTVSLRSERRLSAQSLLTGGSSQRHSASTQTLQSPLSSALPSSANLSGLGMNGNEQQVIAEDILGRGPGCAVSMISMGPFNLLGVLAGEEDSSQLLIYDLSVNEFELVRDIPLTSVISEVFTAPVIRGFALVDEWQVLVLVGTTLLLVSSVDDEARKYQRRVVADPIESFEYLHTDRQLWVFDGQEAIVTDWMSQNESDKKRFVASVPLDAYPVHFSSSRGTVALIESEPVRSYDGSFSVARPTFSHEIYIQFLLEAALNSTYETAVSLARKYSRSPYFAGVLESLLYRVVTSDSETSVNETKLAVDLIREFGNQNSEAIFAGCARKVEMKYWPKLFDAVNCKPDELFDLCLQRNDLETANEYLIVVQASNTDTTEGLDLHGRILSLYNAAAKNSQFWICRQVCEFIMAVDPSGKSLSDFRKLTLE